MLLNEFIEPPKLGYQDVNSDNSKPTFKSTRKTKLTLKQIRKLRRMLDVRNFEQSVYLDQVRRQYGPQPDQAAGGMPAF